MPAYATFDFSAFPLARVTFTGAPADEDNFSDYLSSLEQPYLRASPFVYLFDARQAAFPSLHYQRQQAEWLNSHAQLMKAYCKGTAYLIRQPLLRIALKGIFAIQSQPVPYVVTGTEAEALSWAAAQLHGLNPGQPPV